MKLSRSIAMALATIVLMVCAVIVSPARTSASENKVIAVAQVASPAFDVVIDVRQAARDVGPAILEHGTEAAVPISANCREHVNTVMKRPKAHPPAYSNRRAISKAFAMKRLWRDGYRC